MPRTGMRPARTGMRPARLEELVELWCLGVGELCLREVGSLAFMGAELCVWRERNKLGRKGWSDHVVESLESKAEMFEADPACGEQEP